MATSGIGCLTNYAPAKAMVDGADSSEQAEQSPEQRHAQDVAQVRLGIRQQIDAISDQKAPAGDDDVAQQQRGPPPSPPAQVDQGQPDEQGDELGWVVTGDDTPGSEDCQQDPQDESDQGFDLHEYPL
jgi:hypothetical protein